MDLDGSHISDNGDSSSVTFSLAVIANNVMMQGETKMKANRYLICSMRIARN